MIKHCTSAGDALRELDSMGVIRSDPFIIISGEVVSNMNLSKAIAFHREKKRQDNNAVLTLVLKSIPIFSCIRPVRCIALFNPSPLLKLFSY